MTPGAQGTPAPAGQNRTSAAPCPMNLGSVEAWLDDLDSEEGAE
ncbi:hypothetical protein [Pseudoflavonifractor capillosus]|nr:hypothetical protein [Pseudoflavonifractor capillosus]MDY4659906.1 hypothetical protein [Pseudoflavonifractor capillosus]